MPTLVSNYVPPGVNITLQAENGMLGVGPFPKSGQVPARAPAPASVLPASVASRGCLARRRPSQEDCDLINAGKQTVTEMDGSSFFSADQSFAMIRGAHCQVTILGTMEVAANGDMANYLIPGKLVKGMGGAMDLVASGSRVIVTTEHTDKKG